MKNEINFLYLVLSKIEPYLQDIVLIGGFASLLYRFHEEADQVDILPLITYDVDLASGGEVPIRGEKSIHSSLEEAGLRYALVGNYEQPIVKYYPIDEADSAYYVEFLAPLFGSGNRRDGKPDLTQEIQEDLAAQKLRYLDLLLQNTWTIHTSSVTDLQDNPNLVVRVPHPCMYIMQKVLTLKERPPTDRSKDFAYIYQTLTCFRKSSKSLAHQYEGLITNPVWEKWYYKFVRLLKAAFYSPDEEGPTEGSQILDDVTPEMMSAAVMSFISNCPKIE